MRWSDGERVGLAVLGGRQSNNPTDHLPIRPSAHLPTNTSLIHRISYTERRKYVDWNTVGLLKPRSEKQTNSDPEAADVAACQGGDRLAFERLYRRHLPKVSSMARWMIGSDLAEDAIQEVFLTVWNKIGSFEGRSLFSTWLYRVATTVILRSRERNQRYDSRYVGDDAVIDSTQSRHFDMSIMSAIEQGVESLSQPTRDVFILFDMVGYSHQEISTRLKIAPGTSRWHLHNARLELRKFLD